MPSPLGINLSAMLTIKEEFGVSVGYSDRLWGSSSNCCGAMGATVIESTLH